MKDLPCSIFPFTTTDKIRYSDTDRQGHVNNAIFSTFLETGRVEFLYNPGYPILQSGHSFVIASLHLQFLKEIMWPGSVVIGTGLNRVGNSSLHIAQNIYQNDTCVACAQTIIVQVDAHTGKSAPLSAKVKETLHQWILTDVQR